MSLLEQLSKFKATQLRPTETKERTLLSVVSKSAVDSLDLKDGKTRVVLILSRNMYGFHDWLAKDVTKVLFTTPKVGEHMTAGIRKFYNHVECFENYERNPMVELHAFEMHKKYQFTHVISLTEEDTIRAAHVRRMLGLKHGQDIDSALRFRDKVLMKERLVSHGLSVPPFRAVDNAADIIEFVTEHGFPVVVKPRRGYGSVNTTVLRSFSELEALFAKGFGASGGLDPQLDLEVEKFITGDFYHIDGLVHNHKAVFIWPSKYTNTVVDFQKNRYIAGYSLSPENPLTGRLQAFMNDCLMALEGPSTYSFHGEAWHTPDDTLVFCEVASRTGGGEILGQMIELFDIHVTKAFCQAQCEHPFTNKEIIEEGSNWRTRKPKVPHMVGWVFVYPTIGTLVSLPDQCDEDYVVEYFKVGQPGQVYHSRKDCADAVASFIVKGNTEQEVATNIELAYQWFEGHAYWENVA